MILDSLENASIYFSLNPSFQKAFEFIQETDLHKMEMGKHEITPDLFVISEKVNAKAESEALLEAHKEFIDIQLCISGVDNMGWRSLETCGPLKEGFEDRDLYFFEGTPHTYNAVSEGQFAIFFPGDAHAPNIGEGELHKIIFKVRVKQVPTVVS